MQLIFRILYPPKDLLPFPYTQLQHFNREWSNHLTKRTGKCHVYKERPLVTLSYYVLKGLVSGEEGG